MAYEKNTWKTGDTVTSAKLNHMEDGIASGGAMIVNSTYDESADTNVLNKTWQEIHDAIQNGTVCFIFSSFEGAVMMEPIINVASPNLQTETGYSVIAVSYINVNSSIEPIGYYASTANEYPTNG